MSGTGGGISSIDSSRQRGAAAVIQGCFEASARHGFVVADSRRAANRVIEMACAKHPRLIAARLKPAVLAAFALTTVLKEVDELPGLRLVYAQALGSIVIALSGVQLSRPEFSTALDALRALMDFYRAFTDQSRSCRASSSAT